MTDIELKNLKDRLWHSADMLRAGALNDNGKAALVMANSASDAGGSELEIRKKMIIRGSKVWRRYQ